MKEPSRFNYQKREKENDMANAAGQIYELIPKVMGEVGAIEKGRKNEQQKYYFRGIDDVLSAFQPVLAKHQVFYLPEVIEKVVVERESRSGGVLIYTTLTVRYTFYAPDGSAVQAVVVGEAMDSGDKSSNKAMSAALKYALLQIFCVPTEADDADADSHELKNRPNGNTVRPNTVPADEAPSPTLFWLLQREYGVPKEQAQAIVKETGDNWKVAVDKLKTLIPEVAKAQGK